MFSPTYYYCYCYCYYYFIYIISFLFCIIHHLGGATTSDVRLLSSIAHSHYFNNYNNSNHNNNNLSSGSQHAYCKASGGIRTGQDAINMLEGGADRLGTSATVTVFKEATAILAARSHNN